MTTTSTKEMKVSEEPAMPPSAPEPHPKLRDLDVLEGEWRLEGRDSSGEPFTGTVRRRWSAGRFFLEQQMRIDGQQHEGTEYIGYDFAAESLRSMLSPTRARDRFARSLSSTSGTSPATS